MPDTQGFDVVIEGRATVLRKALWGAWKSATCEEDPGETGRIPENMEISATDGFSFNGYNVTEGQIQIPQEQLDATLAPDIDGTELKFGLNIQAEVADPPIPSLALLNLSADVRARAPIGVVPGGEDVIIFLDGLPASSVQATLTSPNPVSADVNPLIREYIHAMYELDDPNVLPHNVDRTGQQFSFFGIGGLTVDTHTEIYDDLADPLRQITVVGPTAGKVDISIPIYVRIFNIVKTGQASNFAIQDPMGFETRITMSVPFADDAVAGEFTADFGAVTLAGVSVAEPVPAGPEHGVEGPNYTASVAAISSGSFGFVSFPEELKKQLQQQGLDMAHAIGLRTIAYPTNAQLEAAIATLFHAELVSRGQLSVWTPSDAPEIDFEVSSVATRVFADMFAIALNAGDGANIGGLTSFMPDNVDFSIGLSAGRVNGAIAAARDDNGLEDSDLPKRLSVDGEDADINELDVVLTDGALHISGEVTVIDAILGSIDVDADFSSNIGLQWVDSGDSQRVEDFQIGEPEIDPEESVAMWVIGLIIGLITGGLGGLLIAALILLIITLVVSSVAKSIGGAVVTDEVSGRVVGFGGWPERLSRIGRVTTRFENPIVIQTSGMIMSGNLTVISSCEATAVAFADSGAGKTGSASQALMLTAQNTHSDAVYSWLPGDGSAAQMIRDLSHTYDMSGFYVAKHSLRIDQPGGDTSRHFAAVRVANIPPQNVDAGPDIEVNEGEVVTLVGRFRDVEYLDTHKTMWSFGDHHAAKPGVVSETNAKPYAVGTSTVDHAWCQNGDYIVTFQVRDQNGGIAYDTLRAKVNNVAPTVDAGADMFAYRCTPITLCADFEDKGWCDKHTAQWDFGDCSEPEAAAVREVNRAPAAQGIAVASHIYECCGRFVARCTVTDEDGASGFDERIVEVTTLENAGFEDGFRRGPHGKVANDWTPYILPSRRAAGLLEMAADPKFGGKIPLPAEPTAQFDCEECVVHEGQRSQAIMAGPDTRAGLYQRLGANPDWGYQLSGCAFAEPGASVWLGIDPAGGTDPAAPHIIWSHHEAADEWVRLGERVVASARAITVFVETESTGRGARAFHDDVRFVAVPCDCGPEDSDPPRCNRKDKPVEPAPVEPERCADISRLNRGTSDRSLVVDGFTFSALGKAEVLVTAAAPHAQGGAIVLSPAGLVVLLPFPAKRVRLTVVYGCGKPIRANARDAAGAILAQTSADPGQQGLQSLTLEGAGIRQVEIAGQEGLLLKICAVPDKTVPTGYKGGKRTDMAQPDPATKVDTYLADEQRKAEGSKAAYAVASVIISLDNGPASDAERQRDAVERAAAFDRSAEALIAELEQAGATGISPLWIANAVKAEMPLSELTRIAGREDVRFIASNRKQKLI